MSFFVGLWPLLLHWGVGVCCIVACLAVAFFSGSIAAWPPLKVVALDRVADRIRNIALITAGGIALGLFCYATGVSNEAARCKLQFTHAKATAVKRGTTARTRAGVDVDRGVRDSRDTDANQ